MNHLKRNEFTLTLLVIPICNFFRWIRIRYDNIQIQQNSTHPNPRTQLRKTPVVLQSRACKTERSGRHSLARLQWTCRICNGTSRTRSCLCFQKKNKSNGLRASHSPKETEDAKFHWDPSEHMHWIWKTTKLAFWSSLQPTLLLLVRASYIYGSCSSRTSRSWWIAHSTLRRGCNNIPSFLQRTAPIARSFCEGFTRHDLHTLVTAPFCCDRKVRAACAQSFALWQ